MNQPSNMSLFPTCKYLQLSSSFTSLSGTAHAVHDRSFQSSRDTVASRKAKPQHNPPKISLKLADYSFSSMNGKSEKSKYLEKQLTD